MKARKDPNLYWSNGRKKKLVKDPPKRKPRGRLARRGKSGKTLPVIPQETEALLVNRLNVLGRRIEDLSERVEKLCGKKRPIPTLPDLPVHWHGSSGAGELISDLDDAHLVNIISKAIRDPLPSAARRGEILAVAIEAGERGLFQTSGEE